MSKKSTAHGKGGLARQAGTPQTTEVERESASCKGKNHVFLPCEECKHNGRCKKQKQIPMFCLKGCIMEEKTAKDNKPQTIHELLVRKYGEDKLKSNALTLLDDYYKRRCTFENVLHEFLRDRQDPKFEEYNKASGLGRAAMCLGNSDYQEWTILSAALAAFIEKLKGER